MTELYSAVKKSKAKPLAGKETFLGILTGHKQASFGETQLKRPLRDVASLICVVKILEKGSRRREGGKGVGWGEYRQYMLYAHLQISQWNLCTIKTR